MNHSMILLEEINNRDEEIKVDIEGWERMSSHIKHVLMSTFKKTKMCVGSKTVIWIK